MPIAADFAVMSPILRWNLGNVELPSGAQVVRMPEDLRPDLSADPHITEDQKKRLRACEFWLVQDLPAEEQPSSRPSKTMNPLYFLELGLQADNAGVRSFLWTTGIDSLLVANTEAKFKRRISNLLGANSYVFPADGSGRQPIYKVEKLASRMYKLRSLIAHGVEIDESFRRRVGFQTGGSFPLTGKFLNYLEADILNEAALFLLCAVLRRIVVSKSLFDLFLVQDDWTRALDTAVFPSRP